MQLFKTKQSVKFVRLFELVFSNLYYIILGANCLEDISEIFSNHSDVITLIILLYPISYYKKQAQVQAQAQAKIYLDRESKMHVSFHLSTTFILNEMLQE